MRGYDRQGSAAEEEGGVKIGGVRHVVGRGFRRVSNMIYLLGRDGAYLSYRRGGKGVRSVELINVPPSARERGHARGLLQLMTGRADKRGHSLRLVPSAQSGGGLTTAQLGRWYARHGFRPTKRSAYDFLERAPRRRKSRRRRAA